MKNAPCCVAAAALLFASAGFASRFAPPGVPAALFGVIRLLVGGILLAACLGPRAVATALSALPRAPLCMAAVAMALFQWSYFAAVEAGGVAIATLVSAAASPVFADAIDAFCTRTWPDRKRLAGACLVALGVACLAHGNGATGASLMLSLLAGAAYAGYATAAAELEQDKAGGGIASTAISLVFAGMILLPGARPGAAAIFSPQGLLVAAYLGIAATALAYALFATALRQLAPARALAILLLQPLAAVLLGVIFLDEPVSAALLEGVAAISLALAVRAAPRFASTPQRSQPCP